jgi:hypothetical protein
MQGPSRRAPATESMITVKQNLPILRAGGRGVAGVMLCMLAAACATTAPGDGLPRLGDKPDFSGVWESTAGADYDLEPHANRPDGPPGRGVVEGNTIPYLPAALKQRQRNLAARETDDPRLKGWTLGVPRGVYYPEPFQIFQRDQDLTIVFQFGHSVRTIYKNRTNHPDGEPQEYWMGDSRAHWEGDTLVVDVRDFADDTWLDRAGNFHSTELHVVERWKFLDANTIEYHATLDDPKVFSAPWSLDVLLYRHREPGFELIEDYRYTQGYDAVYPPRKEQK